MSCLKKILKRHYHIKNIYALFIIRIIDIFLCFLSNLINTKKHNKQEVKKIIISNIAHLGDNLLTSVCLNNIQSKFPNASIDVLTSSSSECIYQENSVVKKIFNLDHWKLNRSRSNISRKIVRYLFQYLNVLFILRRRKYDLAIDFYSYYPNTIFLFYLARCKLILCYKSGGFSDLAYLSLDFVHKKQRIVDYHFDLLQLIGIEKPKKILPVFNFKYENYSDLLPKKLCGKYILLQPFSPNHIKEWNLKSWIKLSEMITLKDINIFLLGLGNREKSLCDQIILNMEKKSRNKIYNLANNLNWNQYLSLLSDSKLLVGLDSFAVHIGSVLGIKTISINTGINPDYLWRPLKSNILMRHHTVCYPCGKGKGCLSMDCIKNITPENVLFEVLKAKI